MALTKEVQDWLNDLKKEGGLTDEQVTAISAASDNPKAQEFIKGSVLRQSEFSKKYAAFDAEKAKFDKTVTDLATKEAAVTKFQAELGTWKAGAEENYKKALSEREKAESLAQAALARMKTVAETYGLPEDTYKFEGAAPVPDPKVKEFDASQYVRREDVLKHVQESALLDAMIHDIAVKHQVLFGAPLTDAVALVQEAMSQNKSLTGYWEEKYKVVDKRKEVDELSIKKRIDDAVAAKETELRSTLAIDSGIGSSRPDVTGSPLFKENALPRPTGSESPSGGGVSAALAAFNAGKYKTNSVNR